MANEDTTVDPQLEDAADRRRESDPVIPTTAAKLRNTAPPIPRRTPTGTPSIPLSPSAVPLRDPAQALSRPNTTMMGPSRLPRATTVRQATVIPSIVRPATTPPRAPTTQPANPHAKLAQPSSRATTAPADLGAPVSTPHSPAFERAVTAPANYPVRPQSGSQPMTPVVRAATTGAHLIPRTTTASGVQPIARARGTTVIPVPPLAVPVASALAPTPSVAASSDHPLFPTPPAPLAAPVESVAEPLVAAVERSGPLFATPPQPLPVRMSPFPNAVRPIPAPVISYEPPSAPVVVAAAMTPTSSGVMRVPTMIDANAATHSSQPIAARMAAALPAPRPILSPMVVPRAAELPPYIPAPNLGDPGEAVATVRVEKIEFTELVEKYAPLPTEPGPELPDVTPAFEVRKLGKTALRLAPLIGAVALLMVFVIGYLVFDGDGARGRSPMTNVKAPIVIKSVAPAAAPAPAAAASTSDTSADEAKADTKPDDDGNTEDKAPKTDAKADADAKPAIGAVPGTADVKPAITQDTPKPARGRIYITSNKPAQIFLDGKSANATTPRQFTVRAGWHKVTLWETASGKTVTQQIEVGADKVVTINKKFE